MLCYIDITEMNVIMIPTNECSVILLHNKNRLITWWRHNMEKIAPMLTWPFVRKIRLWEVYFPYKRPEMWSFDVFFVVNLNKVLNKNNFRRHDINLWDAKTLMWPHCG